jgi:ElaB/YqjD/DUF883 family membrane-anchored ribosome-binding protein
MSAPRTEAVVHAIAADASDEIAKLREKVEFLMAQRVTPAVSAVAAEVGNAAAVARDTVRAQSDRIEDAVKDQPFLAIGLAALAGFVAGSLFKR